MSEMFQKIGILGGGLLGGSVELALRGKADVRLWFRKAEAAVDARRCGYKGASADLSEVVEGCDLLILAVPVGAMAQLLEKAVEVGLPAGCLVTDVGSVKRAVHEGMAEVLGVSGQVFIGSHPMAGSERNGLGAARADLFQNAACLMTNDDDAGEGICTRLENFWKMLGCRTYWFTASEHDEIVAKISHLPHVTAAATALSSLEDAVEHGGLAGGGLRDTTRVAGGNPEMWAEILMENREAVMGELRDNIGRLHEILALLEGGDLEATRDWLAAAKLLRDTLS
jgi:prephenate dehydrogenase